MYDYLKICLIPVGHLLFQEGHPSIDTSSGTLAGVIRWQLFSARAGACHRRIAHNRGSIEGFI